MSKKIQRPIININRIFEDKRTALEAFAAALIRDMKKHSVHTFEDVKQPQYTVYESEGKQYDTNT